MVLRHKCSVTLDKSEKVKEMAQKFFRVLGVALLGLSLTVSASAARTSLNRGVSGEPNTLDPHKLKLLSELVILRDLFEGLSKSDAEGNIIPGAAVSWEISEDGKVFTFNLRPNLRWSDGHDLTAEDFVAGYQRLFDPATAAQAAAFLYTIKNGKAVNAGELPVDQLGVSAPDSQTVRIELRSPSPKFPTLLLSAYTSPFPRHAYEAFGDAWVHPENLVSNGPFSLVEWVPHDHITAKRNPYYHDIDNVRLEEVIFHPLLDQGTAMKRYRAGELDIAGGIPIRQVEHLQELLPGQVKIHADMATVYLVPNMEFDGLSDVRVRRALSLSMDRKTLTEKVLKGMGTPAFRFSPPSISDYAAEGLALKDRPMEERREEARDLLQEAGFGPNDPLSFQLRATDAEFSRSVVIALRAMWKQVGIEVEIHTTEVKTLYSDLSGGNFEIAVASYYGWDDPNEFLSLFTAATGQMSFNYGRYDNPLYDEALDIALDTADLETRHRRMADAEAIMLEDLAVIPIYFPVARTLVSPALTGYIENGLNVHPTEYMSID